MWFLGRFCKSNRKVGTWRQQRGRSSTSKGPMIAPIQVRSPNDALKSFFEERTQTKSWNLFRSTILGTSAEWESRSARKVSWREIGSFAPPNLVDFSFFIHMKKIFFLINQIIHHCEELPRQGWEDASSVPIFLPGQPSVQQQVFWNNLDDWLWWNFLEFLYNTIDSLPQLLNIS